MPSATFTHTARAASETHDIWLRLQVPDTWSNIGPIEKVWDPVHRGDQLESYRWQTTVGPTSYKGIARVVEAVEPRYMRLDLDAGEMAGTLTTELEHNGEGSTRVTVTLKVVSRGMLSTLFFPVVSDAVGRGLPRQVEQFAASFED
jgi:hypothetical protein